MHRHVTRGLRFLAGLSLFLALSFAACCWTVRQSDYVKTAAAQSVAYPCIGDVLDHRHPQQDSGSDVARQYPLTQNAKAERGIGRQLRELARSFALHAVFSKQELSRMAATLPMGFFASFDNMSEAFFGRHYCALTPAEQDIVLAWHQSRGAKRLAQKVRQLNNPHAIQVVEDLVHADEEYRHKMRGTAP